MICVWPVWLVFGESAISRSFVVLWVPGRFYPLNSEPPRNLQKKGNRHCCPHNKQIMPRGLSKLTTFAARGLSSTSVAVRPKKVGIQTRPGRVPEGPGLAYFIAGDGDQPASKPGASASDRQQDFFFPFAVAVLLLTPRASGRRSYFFREILTATSQPTATCMSYVHKNHLGRRCGVPGSSKQT